MEIYNIERRISTISEYGVHKSLELSAGSGIRVVGLVGNGSRALSCEELEECKTCKISSVVEGEVEAVTV